MLPSYFISHGAPSRPITPSPARDFLQSFSKGLSQPRGIVIISAHWQTSELRYTGAGSLDCLHDFAGFDPDLDRLRYRAHGEPWLCEALRLTLAEAKIFAQPSSRGLDHGAWSPLSMMFPDAAIPVICLSLPNYSELSEYIHLGNALRSLREQDILIIGSGSATHNLYELSNLSTPPQWAQDFIHWLQATVLAHRLDELCQFRVLAPHAKRAHPTDEHFLPLLVAIGSATSGGAKLVHDSYEYGSLNNSCFSFS